MQCAESGLLLESATGALLEVVEAQVEDAKLKQQSEKQIRLAKQLENSIVVLEGELQGALQAENQIVSDCHAKVCLLHPS